MQCYSGETQNSTVQSVRL